MKPARIRQHGPRDYHWIKRKTDTGCSPVKGKRTAPMVLGMLVGVTDRATNYHVYQRQFERDETQRRKTKIQQIRK